MINDIPSNYQQMTSTLYDYNKTIYSLQSVGILFVVLRSIRIISNILLTSLLPFKLLILYKPFMLNLYYFCGLILVTYLRFGTEGTQIPYDKIDQTNGKYYYLFGTNSNINIENQYYINANYTSILLHDCDFTLLFLLLFLILCIPYIKFKKWPNIFKELTIYYLEGSIFELTLGSVGQITQNIQNKLSDPLNIIFSIISGILLIFYLIFTIRPLLALKVNINKLYLNYQTKQQQNSQLYYIKYFIQQFNELIIAIFPIFINNFMIIFYVEIGINGILLFISLMQLIQKNQFVIYGEIICYSLLISSYILLQFNDYYYGFIILILLSIYFIIGQICRIMYFKKEKQIEKQKIIEQPVLQTNIELQSVTLQLDHSEQVNQTQPSKFMLTSQISNIHHTNKQTSQFNSHNTSAEFLREPIRYIQKQQCFQISQFIDTGSILLNKIIINFKFNVKVLNGVHEIDQKILKRNNLGNKIIGVHTFTIEGQQDCLIEEMQIKTYFGGQLLQRDIQLTNKQIQQGQQLEIQHNHQYEQNDQFNEKLAIKFIIDGKVSRIQFCTNEQKLIQISPLTQKSIQKLIDNGINQLIVLFEQRIENFDFEKVVSFCEYYKLLNQKVESSEADYRNQVLFCNFGKIQLILPGSPYIRLILSIEQRINQENIQKPKFIQSNMDLQRNQYIIVSIFAKKSSHQLAYGHKKVCEYYGCELIKYFNQ